MAETISSFRTGVTLTASTDPLSITSSGIVSGTIGSGGSYAIYGGPSQDWQISNAGLVEVADSLYAIRLKTASTITNTGSILGTLGVAIRIDAGPGTVTNSGAILGSKGGVKLTGGGTVGNTGTIGTLSSFGTYNSIGIYIEGGPGTVTNAGLIRGATAVRFKGDYADRVILDPGARFLGTVGGGSGTNTLELAAGTTGATGTLTSFASEFIGFGTITVDSGADWVLSGTGSIGSGVTLIDAGALSNSTTIDTTVTLAPGGILNNTGKVISPGTGTGTLNKAVGVTLLTGGTVTNEYGGMVEGYKYGVRASRGTTATVFNAGTIEGTAARGGGVGLYGGGTVSNAATGTIIGNADVGVYVKNDLGMVTNFGFIQGAEAGVDLLAGGTISNAAGGTISSTGIGVEAVAGDTTVTNAGTISGSFDAINFADGSADRVILYPGAVFVGSVAGSSGTNTLELAAGSAGATGTLSSFGTEFTGFGTIAVDSGATWVLDGTNTIGTGVTLDNAGSIAATATLASGGSLDNTGTISSGTSIGVTLLSTGSVTNETGGLITGSSKGVQATGLATIINAGTITSGNDSLSLAGGGTVVNTGSISASAIFDAIYIKGGAGTVTNTGTISSALGAAVNFSGAYADRVIVDPGAVFAGAVNGGTGTNTLELAAGTTGATGTLSGFGTQFTSFGTIALDSGAKWELDGASPTTISQSVTLAGSGDVLALGTPGSFTDAISGLNATDGIDLVNLAYDSNSTATFSGDSLTVVSGDPTTYTLTLAGVSAGTQFFTAADANGGTLVEEVACFCRGTRILTPRGEMPVECLAVGDEVTTLSGRSRPLTWIGSGRSLVTPANPGARPIVVRQGAIEDGVPARDLYLTKGHSLLFDGVLIPVEFLINDRSIAWDTAARVVEFYHLELAQHDVLLAEGAAAESYREDDNRQLFHNADAPLHAGADMVPCAPVLTGGPEVDRVWARLLARAGAGETELTGDADLHLWADGARVEGEAGTGGMRHRFRLERTPFELHIRSRVCNPVRLGTSRDPRDLGVALRRLVLRSDAAELVLHYDSPGLTEGYNGAEPAEAIRWTTGDGVVPARALAVFEGPLEIELLLGATTRYPCAAAERDDPVAFPALRSSIGG